MLALVTMVVYSNMHSPRDHFGVLKYSNKHYTWVQLYNIAERYILTFIAKTVHPHLVVKQISKRLWIHFRAWAETG